MRNYVSQNHIQWLERSMEKGGNWEMAHRLLDFYYGKCYSGTENEEITQMYFTDYVFLDLLEWLGHNYHLLNTGEKTLLELNKFIHKSILNAKIESYPMRARILWTWINFVKVPQKYDNSNKLILTLLEQYKHIKDIKDVKIELDLHNNLKKLELRLGQLNGIV